MSDMKLYNILETFDKLESAADKLTPVKEEDINEEEVDESQTKVQSMGNKVKVTKDGDTTEYDDAETAKAIMGGDDDDNQFATESADEQYTECPFCHKDILSTEIGKHRIDVHNKPAASEKEMTEEIVEGGFYAGDDETRAADAAAMDAEFGVWDDTPAIPPSEDELALDDEFGVWDDSVAENAACEEDTEFATFDSENEAHRKRLQRGTPVVLDPELFKDPDCNRRGVFVNRSPSGHFGTVIQDLDGKEVKVHLSDIKSADLVNNSVYEEFDINFEAMLAEDITMTQTTNMENPENDTTTVTAVGPEAGEELAAMMANAGLNTGEYASMDAPPIDAGEVDTGEPEAQTEVPVEMPMQGMLDMMDAPETMESGIEWPEEVVGDEFPGDTHPAQGNWDDDDDVMPIGPSNADLDSIEHELDWQFDEGEADAPADDWPGPDTARVGDRLIPGRRDNEDYDDSPEGLLNRQKVRDRLATETLGDPDDSGMDDLGDFEPSDADLDAIESDPTWDLEAEMEESRDIEYSNTPNELEADVEVVTHGTSGGLNRPKRMYKPAGNRHGDNAMQRPMEVTEEDNEAEELDEELSPEMQAQKERDQDKIRKEREWSRGSRKSGSRLTGKGRGTGGHARSSFAGISEEGDELDEMDPDMPATRDRVAGIPKMPSDSLARPGLPRQGQSARRRLRGRHGLEHDAANAMQTDEARAGAPATNDRIVGMQNNPEDKDDAEPTSRRKSQRAGRYLRSKHGMGNKEQHAMPYDEIEEDDNKLVNVHEDVDSFLDLYKEFTIRTDKK